MRIIAIIRGLPCYRAFGRIALFSPPALLFAALLLNIARYGGSLPVLDDWNFLMQMADALSGDPSGILAAFEQFGNHRIIPAALLRTAFLSIIPSLKAELLILSPLLTAAVWAGTLFIARTTNASEGLRIILSCFAASLLFSMHQAPSWMLPITMVYPLTHLLVIGAIMLVFFGPQSWKTLAGAAVLCMLASTTLATGLASWFALLPLLWARRYGIRAMAMWGAMSIAAFSIFTVASLPNQLPVETSFFSIFREHPFSAAGFFLILLGHPLSPHEHASAAWIGLGILLLSAAIVASLLRGPREHLKNAMPWISYWLFGCGAAALVTIGRLPIATANSPFSERYLLIGALPIIALAHMLAMHKHRQSGAACLLLVAILWLLFLNVQGTSAAERLHHRLLRVQACLEMPSAADTGCFSHMVKSWQFTMGYDTLVRLGFIRNLEISGVRQDPHAANGHFDDMQTISFNSTSTGVLARGWATLDTCVLPDHVFVMTASGTVVGHGRTGTRRGDLSVLRRCERTAAWEAPLSTIRLRAAQGQMLRAWAYDEQARTLRQIPGELTAVFPPVR